MNILNKDQLEYIYHKLLHEPSGQVWTFNQRLSPTVLGIFIHLPNPSWPTYIPDLFLWAYSKHEVEVIYKRLKTRKTLNLWSGVRWKGFLLQHNFLKTITDEPSAVWSRYQTAECRLRCCVCCREHSVTIPNLLHAVLTRELIFRTARVYRVLDFYSTSMCT